MSDALSLPRPWYLSLTLVWDDANDNPLHAAVGTLLRTRELLLPAHHRLVRTRSRHTTAFAILQINRVPCAADSLREFARELLSQLATNDIRAALVNRAWNKAIEGAGLSLKPSEVKVFDDGTTLQFHDSPTLARFRDLVRAVLADPVTHLLGMYPEVIKSLLMDCHKSRGPKAWGSIARSPCMSDKSALRWRLPWPSTFPKTVTFQRFHLLISDHALTNPRETSGSLIEDYEMP